MYTPVNDDGMLFSVVNNNGMPNNDGTPFNVVNNDGTPVNLGTPDSIIINVVNSVFVCAMTGIYPSGFKNTSIPLLEFCHCDCLILI